MIRNSPEVLRSYYKNNCTIVCIASGPSLIQEQIDIIGKAKELHKNDLFVIGVNDNWSWKYKDDFICDYLYAADDSWWNVWLKKINESNFNKPKFFPIKADFAKQNGLIMLPCVHQQGLGIKGSIHCLSNSGAQAIGLAYYLGASKIILIGYDMKIGQDGKIHHFGHHPKGLRNTPSRYASWIPHLKGLSDGLKSQGVTVVNCSLSTAIPESTFKRSDLSTELVIH